MRSIFLALLLSTLCCTSVCAQKVDLNNNRVVAAGGLNLRNAPGLHGDILAKIPMDSLVKVLDHCDYGRDTVGSLPNFLDAYDPLRDSFYRAPLYLSGAWVKVAYHQDTGFLFNAYLFNYEPIDAFTEYAEHLQPYVAAGMNGDYVFFQPGYELFAPINNHNDYHWHGIFGKEGAYYLEQMSLEYVVSHHSEHTFLNLVPGKTKELVYIIGSKRRIPNHPFSGAGFEDQLNVYGPVDSVVKKLADYSLSATFDTLRGHTVIQDVILHHNGRQQSLSLPTLFQSPNPVAVGDIDGDGTPDVITFHDGEVGHLILQLSREAPKGQLVRPVAEELMGDCC